MNGRLSQQEWIDAGLQLLMQSGIEAVRVEPLAGSLGVTKGSFYWHFKDRAALLEAMLAVWSARATGDIIETVEAAGGSPSARLERLFKIVMRSDGRLDLAVRAWAAHDENARRALDRIDRKRMGYLETLFRQSGQAPKEATARARLAYQSLIGQFLMGEPPTRDERIAETLEHILPLLIAERGSKAG